MKNIKTILIAVLSFMLLFSVSCKNEDKTGGGSGGLNIPTASGNPATVGNVVFAGTLNRTALSGISEDEANSGTAPATLDSFQLEIVDSKINGGILGAFQGIQLLSNSDAKVVEASAQVDYDGATVAEYIKITLDDATNPTTATVVYQMGSQAEGMTVQATYEGTLNKDTSAGS